MYDGCLTRHSLFDFTPTRFAPRKITGKKNAGENRNPTPQSPHCTQGGGYRDWPTVPTIRHVIMIIPVWHLGTSRKVALCFHEDIVMFTFMAVLSLSHTTRTDCTERYRLQECAAHNTATDRHSLCHQISISTASNLHTTTVVPVELLYHLQLQKDARNFSANRLLRRYSSGYGGFRHSYA